MAKREEYQFPRDHNERMRAAGARAQWELGDASWAGVILAAYMYPESDSAALRDEMDPDVS